VHAAKVTAVKRRCPDLFVNVRVDNFWIGEDATVGAVLGRAAQYAAAGADGVFVPGVNSPDVLRELAAGTGVPLNVLVIPALSLGDLAKLGVRRVSTGSLPYRAALLTATGVATAVRDGLPVPAAAPYPDLQARLVRYQQADR
jgi:2-methylisocitrate lyase-like PEP mutase family enzyme